MPKDWFPDIPDTPTQAPAPAAMPSGQKDWFPNVPDESPKGYQSPYAGRAAKFESVPENLIQDIGQFGTGLATLGALPIARAYEASQGQPLFRKTDLPELGQAGKDIVDYYVNEYGKPYMEANKEQSFGGMLGKEAQNLGEHFLKAPLATALDILPEKALGAPLGKLSGRLAENVNKLKKTFPIMPAWFEHPHMPEWIKHIHAEKQTEKLVTSKLLEAEQEMKDKIFAGKRELDEAFNAVPDPIKPYLLAAREITDPNVYRNIANHPQVKALRAKAEKFSNVVDNILNLSDDEKLRVRYGGMLMQRLESVRQKKLARLAKEYPKATPLRQETILAEIKDLKPLRFEDLSQPKYMKLLSKLKAGWEKEHAPPLYAGIENALSVKRALNRLKTAPLAKKGEASELAKEMASKNLASVSEADPSLLPPYLKPRLKARILKTKPALTPFGKAVTQHVVTIRDASHSHNINDLDQVNLFRAYRLEATINYMKKLQEMGTKERPGWVKVNLNDEFKKLVANTAGHNIPQLKGEAEIWLPKKVAKALEESLHGNSGNVIMQNKILRIVIGLTNLRNQVAYALNPVFAAKLALQTAAIELFSWKTPKDALYSIAGHIIAAHPQASEVLPNAYILSHDIHMPIDLLMSGISFQKAWAIAKDVGGKMSYGPQDYIRRANAISFLLKRASGAGMPIRNLVKSALNVSTTLKLIEEQTYNVNLTKQLQKHLTQYFGDYSNIASSKDWRQAAKLVFSVPAWLAHTANSVKGLPLEHPIKTALLAQLGRIAQKELQNEDEPDAYKEMGLIPIKDKQGKTKYVGGLDLIVFHGGFEMVQALTNLVFGPDERVDIPSGIAPALATAGEAKTKMDLRTNKYFTEESPELEHPKKIRLRGNRIVRTTAIGKFIRPETGKEVKQTSPPISLLAIENEFPNIVKPIQYAAARKDGKFYTPSRWTFPGYPAPKTFMGEPIEESNEQAALNLLGIPVK